MLKSSEILYSSSASEDDKTMRVSIYLDFHTN